MSETTKLIGEEKAPPPDKWNLVYIIFYLMGIGSLLPWNFFITANTYFMYKLRNTTTESTEPTTQRQKDFESYLAVAATIPNVLFNFITVAVVKVIHQKLRISLSFIFIGILLLITIAFVNIDTDSYQNIFFGIVLATIILLSTFSSVLTASVFGLASVMPVDYITAVMGGQALGGTIAASAQILSIAASGKIQNKETICLSANIFFTCALAITIIGLLGYFSLSYLKFSKFYMQTEESTSPEIPDEPEIYIKPAHSFHYVLKKIWKWGVATYIVFLVTLSCFPGIASLIKPVDESTIAPWFRPYFTPTICFLIFNAADLTGRIVAGQIQLLKPTHHNIALTLALLRIVFIPLIMQCNTVPGDHLPSINRSVPFIHDNISPIVLILLLGLTNGYLGNLSMMHGSQLVNAANSEQAGTLMSLFLTIGLASGSVISLILVKFL